MSNFWDVELVPSLLGTLLANVLIAPEPLLLQTQLSSDYGDTWRPLTRPQYRHNGTAYACTSCSLHLFGITTWLGAGGEGTFSNMYSVRDAVGLVVGTGNVGATLDPSPEEINTYLSRDGGLTWLELLNGSHVYEYGDHGGLLVLVRLLLPTSLPSPRRRTRPRPRRCATR